MENVTRALRNISLLLSVRIGVVVIDGLSVRLPVPDTGVSLRKQVFVVRRDARTTCIITNNNSNSNNL